MFKKIHKRLIVFLVFCVLILAITGCGLTKSTTSSDDGGTNPPPSDDTVFTLTGTVNLLPIQLANGYLVSDGDVEVYEVGNAPADDVLDDAKCKGKGKTDNNGKYSVGNLKKNKAYTVVIKLKHSSNGTKIKLRAVFCHKHSP